MDVKEKREGIIRGCGVSEGGLLGFEFLAP